LTDPPRFDQFDICLFDHFRAGGCRGRAEKNRTGRLDNRKMMINRLTRDSPPRPSLLELEESADGHKTAQQTEHQPQENNEGILPGIEKMTSMTGNPKSWMVLTVNRE
jgi:hypothetical protein